MMTELEFIEIYEQEKPILKEWGRFVKNNILESLKNKGCNIEYFFKVPIIIRLKDNESIINKAFYRGKEYNNPINDITDKVGLRFVVLISDEIKIINDVIENANSWDFSKDRDFEEERDNNPTTFTYQSVHYVLRNKQQLVMENIKIPKGVACEIQIRTLLQHAYSELTHDTVYKPKHTATPDVQRLVARSMAMIETTDCIFKEVNDMVNKNNDYFLNDLLPIINNEFEKIREPIYTKGISDILIDTYSIEVNSINKNELLDFINQYKPVISSCIESKYDKSLLYRQSIILIIYFFAYNNSRITKNQWPFTEDLLRPIYTSLGIRFDNY
ncbi:hypothetical protein OSC52_15160 [Clostridium pasteurianum]|uniref:GTP pyrophosphokinase n=1 Tax=Clostridium pasteurianum TaxID=1501 RepID=UPI0022608D75|nr:hypothetical protein [Clostridium pasteurianum]UZW13175.1 hypothetical protein OSC52_15160 [Clostridium pasteurianum]